jgi:hypothetical protein
MYLSHKALNSAATKIHAPHGSSVATLLSILLPAPWRNTYVRTPKDGYLAWNDRRKLFVEQEVNDRRLPRFAVRDSGPGWFILEGQSGWFVVGDSGLIENALGWSTQASPHLCDCKGLGEHG